VLGVLTGISRRQFYRYATAALALPVIVLAALGLDDLARTPAHRRRLIVGDLVTIAVAAALDARPVVDSLRTTKFHHGTYFQLAVLWGAGVAAVAAAVALVRGARTSGLLQTLLVAVDALVLFTVPELSAPRATTVDLKPIAYLRRNLGE
jgi:hypothetical protein